MNEPAQILTAKSLAKAFAQGSEAITVLHDINLQVGAGERLAIVGRSGSGKSTLLHLLAGLDEADAGGVAVAGETMTPASNEARTALRRQYMGFVYQQHHLLPEFTALENVALPLRLNGASQQDAQSRSADLLERVGLGHRLSHIPSELSGGERQRVAVARALIHGPKLVLADEPTGNLDATSAAELMSLMVELSESRTVAFLVVTHDPTMLHHFDRVLTLTGGGLEESKPSEA
tara:strand:+ start:803 stop:1504 length:702 start_codon:yes stop_codon:yes gene_type:complete